MNKNIVLCGLVLWMLNGCSGQLAQHNPDTEIVMTTAPEVASDMAVRVDDHQAYVSDPCAGIENCTVVADFCDENPKAAACNNINTKPKPPQVVRKYMQNGCEVTEYGEDAAMDCSMRDKKK